MPCVGSQLIGSSHHFLAEIETQHRIVGFIIIRLTYQISLQPAAIRADAVSLPHKKISMNHFEKSPEIEKIKGRGPKKGAEPTVAGHLPEPQGPAKDASHKEEAVVKKEKHAPAKSLDSSDWLPRLLMSMLVIGVGVWAYLPTIIEMVTTWEKQPDYSHGYLVLPMAIFFLWFRMDSYPGFGKPAWVLGISLLLMSVAARMVAALLSYSSVDGWSLLPWIAGTVALLFGWQMLRWSWTSIAFLFFMVPLPYGVETMMSYPLQRIATKVSCWTLQVMGQPAIAEANTILLGEHHLEVEQACSGLRLFVSILALAFGYMILMRRTWWENLFLLVSVVPIAIVSNSARIVTTGLLFEFASSKAAKHFSHDLAGWAMVPLAALLFALVLWYLKNLFPEREQMNVSASIRRA